MKTNKHKEQLEKDFTCISSTLHTKDVEIQELTSKLFDALIEITNLKKQLAEAKNENN